jgi:hypothetical protein
MAELEETADLPSAAALAAGANGGGGSLLEQLVAERERLEDITTEHFPIPNNKGPNGEDMLWAEFRLLPWRQVRGYAEQIRTGRGPTVELRVAATMISDACICVYLRNPATGRREDVPGGDPELNPVGFDERLAEALRLDGPDKPQKGWQVAEIVRKTFRRDLAVTRFQQELITWMEGEQSRVDEEFAGES